QVDELLGQSVAEVVVRVAAHVGEGQHGDRCVLRARRGGDLTRRLFEPDSHVRHRLEALTWLFRQTSADEAVEYGERLKRRRIIRGEVDPGRAGARTVRRTV